MEKSEARALLRFVANDLRDQRAVDGYSAAIRSGEEGFMDHICWDVLEPIYALRDEFAAWEEGHTVHDYRCKARRLLADTAMMFDEPTPEFAEEEMFNKLDVWRSSCRRYGPSSRWETRLRRMIVDIRHLAWD